MQLAGLPVTPEEVDVLIEKYSPENSEQTLLAYVESFCKDRIIDTESCSLLSDLNEINYIAREIF